LTLALLPLRKLREKKIGNHFNELLCIQNLESVIRARIPSITSTINNSIDELESELDHLGRPIAVDAGVSSLFLSQSFLADIHFILSV
jgi:glycerol kinase